MKQSAGLLLFRKTDKGLEFFLVHPGGPFFVKKDAGFWTIPKGEIEAEEAPLETAVREFEEEIGFRSQGEFIALQPITQKGGKKVMCWAVEGDTDPEHLVTNRFEIEWPPRSGKMKAFPEIDRAAWLNFDKAWALINERQRSFLKELTVLRG